MMRTKLKFFLVLLAMMVGGMNGAWGAYTYETVTYHFGTAATNNGTLTMSSTSYSGIKVNTTVVGHYADKLVYTENNTEITEDISKLAFRYTGPNTGSDRGWYLRDNRGANNLNPDQYGLWCTGTGYSPELAICNLHSGDKVTITYSCSGTNYVTYANGAHGYYVDTNDNNAHKFSPIPSGQEITVSQNGDMIIQANDGYTYIKTIEIKTLQDVATYTVVTTEDTSNNTRSTTFTFTGEGRMEDNFISVPFMNVQLGSNHNSPLVEGLGGDSSNPVSHIPDWNGYWHIWFNNGIPSQGTFYKFMPTARGKLQVHGFLGKENSSSIGKIGIYRLDGSTLTQLTETSGGTIPENGWQTLEKGQIYYICENPNSTNQNAFLLHDFTFTNEFNMKENVVLTNGATSGSVAVKGATKLDSYTILRTSSNIKTGGIEVSFSGNSTSGTVNISGIAYNDNTKDKGGVIIMNLELDAGNATLVVTIPYSAEKGHIWNFYDTSKSTNAGPGPLEIGKYSDTSSDLYQETEAGKWKYTYRVINNQQEGTHDPMYQSVELMDGNNAAYIWETEGLIFNTPTLKACLYNENPVVTDNKHPANDPDRYVGILPGGSFTIPGLSPGDRVIIYMGSGEGSGNDVCFFNITGAQDAIGQDISPSATYKAGGSIWRGTTMSGGNYDITYRGAYHFISKGGDMTFYMNGGSMTKIYSIEIYQGKHKHTNDPERQAYNTVTYNNENYTIRGYQYVHRYNDNTNKYGGYQMHYRGKGDPLRDPTVVYKSGTVTANTTGDNKNLFHGTITSANGSVEHWIFYKSIKGEHGMFRMRVDVMEQNNTYVADYGLQNITVGYIDKKTYPYTWDFTDLMKYAYTDSNNRIKKERTNVSGYNEPTEFMDNAIAGTKAIDQWQWYEAVTGDFAQPAGYGLNLRNSGVGGEMVFPTESQLYAGDEFIAEAVGIDIVKTTDSKFNGQLRITDQGLSLYAQSSSEMWDLKIPDVPTTATVYIRAKDLRGIDRGVTVNGTAISSSYGYKRKGNDGVYIYAVQGTGGDMTFTLGDMIVEKIAVSEDFKQFNAKGWTTESREHDIDPSLTAEMNGRGIKTYLVTGVNDATKKVTMTDISNAGLMHSASDGSKYACILRNTEDAPLNVINGGFYLFVPDMHDEQGEMTGDDYKLKSYASSMESSIMKAQVNPIGIEENDKNTIPETEVHDDGKTYTNFAFTFQYYDTGADGVVDPNSSQYHDNAEQAFYRIAKGGAISAGHQGYLPLYLSDAVVSGSRKFTMSFGDETESDITIVEPVQNQRMKADVYYNLNGQQLNGQPSRQGLYIMNGKKMYVK